MRAKMSDAALRREHNAILLRAYRLSECEHGALSFSAEREARAIMAETEPKGRGVTTAQDLPIRAWRMGYIIEPRNPAVVALAEALAAFVGE